MPDDIPFVTPSELFIQNITRIPEPYPIPFPGNIRPTKKPKFSTLVLYQIMRGKNLNHSFKRMVKMMYDIGEVEKVTRKFVDIQDANPDVSGYLNLAKAYADTHGLNYEYETKDYGNTLRVWGKDKEEWSFDIRRGEHMIRGEQNRDYSKMLHVNNIDMISYKELSKERKDLVKPFRKSKK